ncbi:MAG: hypothetical protein IJ982_07380, partial [Fibrobacter sp.]|nr:hypothetical protein [Fibrobacter sp.]
DTTAWRTLQKYAGSTALKSTTGWNEYYGNGTDDYGFAAYPDGYYYTYGLKGVSGKGIYAEFWSSNTSRMGGLLMGTTSGISTYDDDESTRGYNYWPIRCIQDN